MKLGLFFAIAVFLNPFNAIAQSTVTLDDFELNDSTPAINKLSKVELEMKSCLLSSGKCDSKEFGNAAPFSIDDVVNLGVIDREKINKDASDHQGKKIASNDALPSIDIEILFDYNSDKIPNDQSLKLSNLANILRGKTFNDYGFAFLGHADAKGSREFNQKLSERRARAVSARVASFMQLPSSRFLAKGLGNARLKTPEDPFGPANRRVQLVLIPIQ